MIDLHTHTAHSSDGALTVPELLQYAEQSGVTVLSITDHDKVDAYEDLENNATRALFSGKIIKGVEIGALYNGVKLEILGYGFDTARMKQFLHGYPPHEFSEYIISQTRKRLSELGLNLEEKSFSHLPGFHLQHFLNWAIEKHRDFFEKFDKSFSCRHILYRKGLANPQHELYIGLEGNYKNYNEVISWIHLSGGKAFLAHPAEYGENADEVLEALKDSVDGIECFHPSADKAYSNNLVEFCKAHNLSISGGSDFHGESKPHYKIGIGRGDLNITHGLIKDWVTEKMLFKELKK